MSQKVLDWALENLSYIRRVGDENIFDCPFCGGSQRLWYNDSENVYICYRCSMTGTGIGLVVEHEDISYEAARKLIGVSDERYVAPPMLLEEMFARYAEEQANIVPDSPQHLDLPGLLWHGVHPGVHVDHATESAQAILNREFHPQFITDMRCGYFHTGKYQFRTCLPVFVDGYFSYFQAWDHGHRFDKKWKYLNPKTEEVGIGRAQFLYNFDRWTAADVLVITEGVFNAWAVEQAGYAAMATFGKSLSEAQFAKLLAHPCRLLILGHDPDARRESVASCRRLRALGKECLLARVPEGLDWNDMNIPDRQAVLHAASEPDWLYE